MKRVYLIRHGETAANKEGVFRGRCDVSLSDRGLEQASDLAGYFEDIELNHIFSSPQRRAIETAKRAFNGMEITPEELIDNLDHGDWTGVPKAKIEEEDPERWRLWTTEPEKLTLPGGESVRDVYVRAGRFLDKLAGLPFDAVAVVSHRSEIKSIIAAALGIKEGYFWRFHLENASVSLLIHTQERGFTLAGLNDTRHLKDFFFEWG